MGKVSKGGERAWMIYFLLDCDYLPTVLYGGEDPKFRLSEQVIKSESDLLFEGCYSDRRTLVHPSYITSIREA